MAAIRNKQAPPDIHSGSFDGLSLFEECQRVKYDATADDAGDIFMEDARRDNVEDVAQITDADGVPGVVSTLIARHAIEAFGQDVDNLPLALIAPLEPDNCDVLFHNLVRTGFRFRKRVPAFLFDLKQVAGRDRIEPALAEAVLVNAAGIDIPWCIFGFLY